MIGSREAAVAEESERQPYRGVRIMYGSVSPRSKPFALLRADITESAPNLPQSEHPATGIAAGQRPGHPAAGAASEGPAQRLPGGVIASHSGWESAVRAPVASRLPGARAGAVISPTAGDLKSAGLAPHRGIAVPGIRRSCFRFGGKHDGHWFPLAMVRAAAWRAGRRLARRS